MKKRLLFHLLHFTVLNLLIFAAVYIYHAANYPAEFVFYSVVLAYRFVVAQLYNFLLVSLLTYFACYVTGIIKFTMEDRFFRFVGYWRGVFKFLVILGMVSFVEFFVFYDGRIGRLIYVILFVLYGAYYYVYLGMRSDRGPRGLLWMAAVPAENIMKTYFKNPGAFRLVPEGSDGAGAGNVQVVYQDGHIDEHTSEALIKNKLAGLPVVELVELVEKESTRIPVDYVNIHWFLEKFDVVDRNYFRSSRMFNIFLSLVLVLVLFPLGMVLALVHRCFSRGPLFFVQQRVGLHGKTFRMIKFRTMVVDAEKDGARFAGKNDARITPLGKFMRRFRLDEIPQLINVLKGEMSMVGPRPERGVFIESLSRELPYYKLRLLVPPGLTGWAQVNGVYAGHDIADHKEKLEHDLYYIKNRSIFMDLQILLLTVKTIIQGKGE